LPNFEPAWRAACDELESDLCDAREHGSLDPYVLESWTDLLKVIRDNEPRFLRQTGFPERFSNEIRELMELVDAELSCEPEDTSCDEFRSVSHQFERFKNSLEILESFGEIAGDYLRIMLARLAAAKRKLDDRANELEGPDYDCDDYDSHNPSNEFDIDDLFSDL